MKVRILLFTLAVLLLSACGANPVPSAQPTGSGLQISGSWARVVAADMNMSGTASPTVVPTGAIYMTITGGGTADRLLKAESDAAANVEMHSVTSENGMMQMRPMSDIPIPANGSVELKPGGMHIMLIGVKPDVKPGGTISLKLTFEKAGVKNVMAEVRTQ